MSSHRGWKIRIVALGLAASLAPVLCAPCPAATSDEVDNAIKKGVEYLYSRQDKDGTWERSLQPELNKGKNPQLNFKGRQWGGLTSVAVYALLATGENPQDAKLKQSIEFLEKANIQSTYALAMNSLIWLHVPPSPQTKQVVAHNARLLDLGMIKAGNGSGLFTYWVGLKNGTTSATWTGSTVGYGPQNGESMPFDFSNSQYGILGMWALNEMGAEVPAEFWSRAQEAWEKSQQPDGGWRYDAKPDRQTSASMTAAGIATLYILQDFTLSDRSSLCNGGLPNPYIDHGLEWMDNHIDKVVNTPGYYTLYGIERIGVASGRKFFGTTDWYQKGADFIIKHQKPNGSWLGSGELHSHDAVPDTCFALLFLSRGGAPVMMNKLQYDTPKSAGELVNVWNERPRDLANLARWSGRQIERDLNWQVVNLKVAPEELHDAPILYIGGSQQLEFTNEQIDKLRLFVEQGGMILGNADCGKDAFIQSFKALGHKLFPRYAFRPLPPNHPIFTREQYPAANWRARPAVLSLSNGVRELMILPPDSDPSRAWQTRADRTREQLFELGADIFQYAIDKKQLQNKGSTYIVQANPEVKPRRKLKLARVMVGDNPDPEPGAWRRLAAVLHNTRDIDLSTFDVTPGEGVLLAAKVAHLTGTGGFVLGDAARLELKTFVQNGGTLIVDAAGGSSEFAASAENELHTIFGPDAKQLDTPLPASSPLYRQPDIKVDAVGYRTFAREALLHNSRDPRLRAIAFGKKLRVFYSREDLTAGLVGQPVDGVYGYDPQSATNLMTALLLYATAK